MAKRKVASRTGQKPLKPAPVDSPIVEEPATPSLPFPVVGIGASAGGIEAISRLLRALRPDTNMAFVVIQHLDPTHESMLSDIIARATSLPVHLAEDQMPVENNHVYVIPPGVTLELSGGRLALHPRDLKTKHMSVDLFLASLAREQGHMAIGVILSGTATDGTVGLQEIKAEGGITFAQDESAQQDSMPRSAVAAGVVDFELPPEEIARELERIARHPYVTQGGAMAEREARDTALARIIDVLRAATGVDFGNYKRTTLYRRMARRAVLNKLHSLKDYAMLLSKRPDEAEALFQDILISVTSFFRNPEAFEALKKSVFPALAKDRSRNEPIRVWVLGCSTGEEAYSIAIAYTEYAEATGRSAPIQIFATDLNGAGIEKARAGLYGQGIATDMAPERLRRFFTEVDGGYRIAKSIRDKVVFAQHNALAAPPFSHIHLVACRNLLIYLDPHAQQRLLPMLHYALEPEGFLWLGTSETVGMFRDMFDVVEARQKVFQRRPGPSRVGLPLPLPLIPTREEPHRAGPARPVTAAASDTHRDADRILLTRYSPPTVLVDSDLEILQFRGDTGLYLAPAPGKASLNLLKMLRNGLVPGVRAAIQRARKDGAPVREESLHVTTDSGSHEVSVEVIPMRRPGRDLAFLITFHQVDSAQGLRDRAARVEADAGRKPRRTKPEPQQRETVRLKAELEATREYLQSVIEQQEAANEELQSANEEVQSANEELQSINEELETSKEEIQSANEELATVNDELEHRNEELTRVNNDFANLLSSANTAMVMLGPDLRIRRFTPMAERMLNLIAGDLGRPITDIKLPVAVPDLDQVVANVVDSMSVWEQEVQDKNGRWYLVRVRPYRTMENKIEGAVVMLLDVDVVKKTQQPS